VDQFCCTLINRLRRPKAPITICDLNEYISSSREVDKRPTTYTDYTECQMPITITRKEDCSHLPENNSLLGPPSYTVGSPEKSNVQC